MDDAACDSEPTLFRQVKWCCRQVPPGWLCRCRLPAWFRLGAGPAVSDATSYRFSLTRHYSISRTRISSVESKSRLCAGHIANQSRRVTRNLPHMHSHSAADAWESGGPLCWSILLQYSCAWRLRGYNFLGTYSNKKKSREQPCLASIQFDSIQKIKE